MLDLFRYRATDLGALCTGIVALLRRGTGISGVSFLTGRGSTSPRLLVKPAKKQLGQKGF